ncbi:hypothetical protein BDV26DRAFT_289646 [Aspergillus bertholletiae]|uniref:Uncharacterized protein n=1 Tax=Aspergillus bertholletiae TaxID=1226010 RepID=A0A5N7BHF9_9EURO|nr:hypothetical protein BDV26DRAFT_289646 [Aspergillus bertholletiae]
MTSPFYTYALWHKPDEALVERYLIVSDNRASADQLYRGIQEQMIFLKDSVDFRNLKRLSPQMWAWGASGGDDLRELIGHINATDVDYIPERLRALRGKVFIKALFAWDTGVTWPIIPPLGLADHINKRTFFIRNKFAPAQFWAVAGNLIVVSTEQRSRFRIELAKEAKMQNGEEPLLVDSDRVRLTLVRPETFGDSDESRLYIDSNTGRLTTYRQANAEFDFDAFKGGFAIYSLVDTAGVTSSYPTLQSSRDGEVWELV